MCNAHFETCGDNNFHKREREISIILITNFSKVLKWNKITDNFKLIRTFGDGVLI